MMRPGRPSLEPVLDAHGEANIDAGYRSLICAIILRAVHDTRDAHQAMEARDFLTSPHCKSIARLAGIRWQVTEGAIDQAAIRLRRRRRRHQPARTRRRAQ